MLWSCTCGDRYVRFQGGLSTWVIDCHPGAYVTFKISSVMYERAFSCIMHVLFGHKIDICFVIWNKVLVYGFYSVTQVLIR